MSSGTWDTNPEFPPPTSHEGRIRRLESNLANALEALAEVSGRVTTVEAYCDTLAADFAQMRMALDSVSSKHNERLKALEVRADEQQRAINSLMERAGLHVPLREALEPRGVRIAFTDGDIRDLRNIAERGRKLAQAQCWSHAEVLDILRTLARLVPT